MAGVETGVVSVIQNVKTYGEKGFKKRVFVIEQVFDKWTNKIAFELTGDSCDAADNLNIGDKIEVKYRLQGREWQKDASSEVKFFLNAEAQSYKFISGGNKSSGSSGGGSSETSPDDDIPF